jgi:hypothetical protein
LFSTSSTSSVWLLMQWFCPNADLALVPPSSLAHTPYPGSHMHTFTHVCLRNLQWHTSWRCVGVYP